MKAVVAQGHQGKSAALSSVTVHAIPRKFAGRWGTEYFNTRFPVSTLLYVGYSVKNVFINLYDQIQHFSSITGRGNPII